MSSTKSKASYSLTSSKEYKLALSLVAIVGVIGSVYVLSTIRHSKSFTSAQLSVPKETTFHSTDDILLSKSRAFVNEDILFTIKDYNPDLLYSFSTGDSDKITIEKPLFYHHFEKSGVYEVILQIGFQDDIFVIDKHIITVEQNTYTLQP